MKQQIRKFYDKHWKKTIAVFFTIVMVFQASSEAFEIAAYEIGKVNLADTRGKYFNQAIKTDSLNKGTQVKKATTALQKEPVVNTENPTYDPSLEVMGKRTENSKTYKLANGTYVQETYFEPVHKKVGKEYVEIDNTLANSNRGRSTPIYENKDGLYAFKVEDDVMSITSEAGQPLSIIHSSANLTTYQVKENVILYSNAYDNIDMEYRLHGNAVSTNFYLNGTTSTEAITLQIKKGDLKVKEEVDALTFLNDKEEVVYSYTKPIMYDGNNEARATTFSFTEKDDTVSISMVLDREWVNHIDRIYPVMMSARAVDESAEISVETAYNRSAAINTTSNYYDLFVGFEDGSLSGGTYFGAARTYVHVTGMNLGPDKLILSGTLRLWKRLGESSQWNEITIGKTSGYVRPKDATWKNKPSVTPISATTVRRDAGWQDFDVKAYVEDIYRGVNNTIELKATNESSSYTSNVFSSESGDGLPVIAVTYRDAFDVNPNLPLDTFDTEMRIFSIFNKGFEALSFDGIARPDSQVQFDLVERGKDTVIKTETSKGSANKYFVDPIYVLNVIANTQTYPKNDVNYTTDYIYKNNIPEFDTPYEYKVKVQGSSAISTQAFRTDSFIKYKVKTGDNLKNLAAYYGLTIDELKADNNLTTNMIKEDDVLIIRFKKNNDKVSKDVYTPPTRTIEYKAKYVNRGPRCSSGTCPVIDPVNATTGNYYYEGIDFTMKDAEDFDFVRYYNSTGPQLSNMFGNGFTTEIESYISYDKSGNMIYFTGDGKIYEFQKNGSSFTAKNEDNLAVSIADEKVTIKDFETSSVYEFDVYGYLDTITSKEGTKTKLSYDNYGLITTVKVGEKSLQFTYNDGKLVKDITLPDGSKVSYQYDEHRNLTTFTDTFGKTKTYTYDANHFLTSIIDKKGVKVTQNTYDSEGRVTKQIDGNGNTSTLTYGTKQTTLHHADGSIEEYTFNDKYDILSIKQDGVVTSSYTYDAYRNITSTTDEDGKVTKHTYDKQNLLKSEYPDGTYEEYQYDALGNTIYKRDKDGNITTSTYVGYDLQSTSDAKHMSTVYEYDSERRITKETDQFGNTKQYTYDGFMIASITYSSGFVESFAYDALGNVVKESDNQGKNTTYIYHANNQVSQKNYYDGTNEQWTYDNNGNIIRFKDRIGGITTNTYDKNNNLISTTKGNLKTTKSYNEVNQLISETDEKGLTKQYTYDVYGNKMTETDGYGNIIKNEYDAQGNITKTIDVFGNTETNTYENGNLVKVVGIDDLITTYQYDSFNREIAKTNPNGTVETKTYDGLYLASEVDGKGTTIHYEYDTFGRVIKTTTTYTDGVVSITQNVYDRYGNIIETLVDGVSTKYVYDVYQQLISSTDALGNTVMKDYDLDGNLVKEIDALGNAVTTKYDAVGNITSIIDKNGNINTKTYNQNGQLISEKDALGYIKSYTYNHQGLLIETRDPYHRKAEYKYDAYGNVIETKLEGKVIEQKKFDKYGREVYVANLESITSTTYDNLGRTSKSTNELTGLSVSYQYDKIGNVIAETDSEGLTTSYFYDLYQRKIKVIDPAGRSETYQYNARDLVLKTKAFDGTITKSVYDEKGNVIKATDALGKVTKYTYNVCNQLVKEKSGQKVTEFVYDANGQQVEVKNINNETSSKSIYDKNGNVIESIDVLGNTSKITYDAKNQVIANIDANGNIAKKEYDAYGNVVKEMNALGYCKQTKYNANGLKELEIDERGFDVTYVYNDDLLISEVMDSNGRNAASFVYNDKKQLIKETDANGGVTQHEYDAYGREVKTIVPNGLVSEVTYDALGNVVYEKKGKQTTTQVYDKLGRLKKTKVNDVVQVRNKYNRYNQVVKSFDANNNESTYRYDLNGNTIYSDEKGTVSEKEYDVYDNLTKQVDNQTFITENTYDKKHQLIMKQVNGKVTQRKTYDSLGNEIHSFTDGVETRTVYNAINKVIKTEAPSVLKENEYALLQSITYDEAGNPIEVTDANGNIEEKQYDAFNNVIEETNKNGFKTLYEYDGMNNPIKVQNHEDRYVSYAYDSMNNVILKTVNDKYAEYEYDEDNNLILETNENGYQTTYSYDEFNRKVKQEKPDGKTITYTYDNLGNKLSENKNTYTYDARGNILTATNQEGTVTNTYDAFDQKTKVVDTLGKEVVYRYNADNKLSEKEYAGIKATYQYNDNGLLETVKKNQEVIAQYAYNAKNEVVELTQGTTVTSKTYDEMGLVLTQKTIKDDKVIYDAAYTYDGNQNVIQEIIDGKTNTYRYDGYDELIESHKYIDGKLVNTTYKNDIYGNQVSKSSNDGMKVYKYNDKNQIESIDTDKGMITYTYDDNGNVSKKVNEDGRIDLYSYDDLNQLTKLIQGQYTYDYKYDAEQERISQKRTDTKDYHYDQWYQYSEPLEVVSNSKINDTFENLKDQVKKKEANGEVCIKGLSDSYDVTYFKEPETIDYTVDRTMANSEVLSANDTVNVYGDALLQSNDESIINGWNNSVVAKVSDTDIKKISYSDYGATKDILSGHGYNGETLDRTGLIYLRARYYDPGVSRFVQIDTKYDGEKENVASQNKYVYTLNNPYKYVDKNGEKAAVGGAAGMFVKKPPKEPAKKSSPPSNSYLSKVGSAIKDIADSIKTTMGIPTSSNS